MIDFTKSLRRLGRPSLGEDRERQCMITVRVPLSEYERATSAAIATGRSLNVLCRQAIADACQQAEEFVANQAVEASA